MKILRTIFAVALGALVATSVRAQFAPGELLTAGALNAAFTGKLSVSGGAMTGPLTVPGITATGSSSITNLTVSGGSITGLSTPLPVGSGGTGCMSASGTCLDNISGLSAPGIISRAGAGTYNVLTDPLPVSHGGVGVATPSGTALDNITGFTGTGIVKRTGAGAYSFVASPLSFADGGTNSATAIGATSQLQYLQGGMGSVARTLTSKFQDVISVKDCSGVVGDDSNDDTAGIQACEGIAAITGKALYFPQPAVAYLITSSVSLDDPSVFYGDGKYATIVHYTGSGAAFVASGTGNNHVRISDMTIKLTTAGATGIDASRFIGSTISRTRVASLSTSQTGVLANPSTAPSDPFFNVLLDNTFDGAFANGVKLTLTAPATNAANRWRLIGNTYLNNAICINLDNVEGAQLIGEYFDQNTSHAIKTGPNTARVSIISPTMETSAGGDLLSIDSASNRIDVISPKVFAGSFGYGSSLGLRGMIVGDWDTGIIYSGSGSATPQAQIAFGAGIGLQQMGIASVSSTTTFGNNLRGAVNISNSATTGAVTFALAEPNSAYYLAISATSNGGTPAAGAFQPYVTSKTASGFTINLQAAPGTGNTVEIDWVLIR